MEIKDIISITISIIAIFVTLTIFYISEPENISPAAIIISVIILLISFIGFIASYIYSRWRSLSSRIRDNKKEIIEMNKSIKQKELYNNMEKRLSILERLLDNKKAQSGIDPRILYWIILLILLYLLLNSTGFL